jgi:hypothetical protein
MRARRGGIGVVIMATSIVLAGCRGERREAKVEARGAGIIARDSTRALGPGDIRIVSVDTTLELTLLGDNLVTGLADKALAKVRHEMDTGRVQGTGLTAKLERFVKSSVQSAVGKQVLIPVASVSDVRFDNGRLELIDLEGKRMATFGPKEGGTSGGSGVFAPADADAFIIAFRIRKARSR